MDEEKLIQVSFQIPPSALDSLSKLAEQLRMLTETVAAQTVSAPRAEEGERGRSDSFDSERFLALRQSAEILPQTVRSDVSDIEDAKTVSAAVSQVDDTKTASAAVSQVEDAEAVTAAISQSGDAEAVSAEVQKELQDAESAGDTLYHHPEDTAVADMANDPWHTPLEERDFPLPPAETIQVSPPDNIPSVRADAEKTVPYAPEARRDVEQQIPDIENARTDTEKRDLALAAVQSEVSGGVETPLGAGVVVQTQPEMPQSRWSDVAEELVIPGPAPLTAEAVSLAFERDGRRYDNGFPLY